MGKGWLRKAPSRPAISSSSPATPTAPRPLPNRSRPRRRLLPSWFPLLATPAAPSVIRRVAPVTLVTSGEPGHVRADDAPHEAGEVFLRLAERPDLAVPVQEG